MKTLQMWALLFVASKSAISEAATPEQVGTYTGVETVRFHNVLEGTVTVSKSEAQLIINENNTVSWSSPNFSYSGNASIGPTEGMFTISAPATGAVPFQFKKGGVKGAYTAGSLFGGNYLESKYKLTKQ